MRILNCKKVLTGLMLIMMMVGMNPISASATSVTTSVHHSSGGYTFYVRESGNTNLLGTMSLNKSSVKVTNTFTAAQSGNSVNVHVSEKGGEFKNKYTSSMPAGYSLTATKYVSNPSMIYGYCTVTYKDK